MESNEIKVVIKGVPLSRRVLVTVEQASILFNLDANKIEGILHSEEELNLSLLCNGREMIKRESFAEYVCNNVYSKANYIQCPLDGSIRIYQEYL